MIELTQQQQAALASSQNAPLEVFDPASKRTFVLLATEVFDRLKDLLEVSGDWADSHDMRAFLLRSKADADAGRTVPARAFVESLGK